MLSRLAADLGEQFRTVTPEFQPLFVSLPALSGAQLESSGSDFGWILELTKRRRAPAEEFRALVGRVVAHLERLSSTESQRWRDLLSYLLALVYHDREESEQQRLREWIAASVRSDDRRREVSDMSKTIAEGLREEGRVEGRVEGRAEGRAEGRVEEAARSRQQILLRQLRVRFRKVPKGVERVILRTMDVAQLDGWLERIVACQSLSDMHIGTAQ
jgi:hypothetical protein